MKSSSLVAFVPVVVALLACGYDNEHDVVVVDDQPPPPAVPNTPGVENAPIDTDAGLDTQPGEGAGVFVEYAAGGKWHVFTSCDTIKSGFSCRWDIVVTPVGSGAKLTNLTGEDLEAGAGDEVSLTTDGSAWLLASTDTGLDGFFFDTNPGATVRLDVVLDQRPEARYVYWVGGGGVQRGAPSNPLDLTPTAP
jgi:hypothetical protein